jgi:hypothetical protein
VNFVGFQVGWFSSVLGAAHGIPWLGTVIIPLVLAAHLALSPGRKAELLQAILAGIIGFCLDSVLITLGVFTPVFWFFPAPFSPPWMVMLWVNFAITLNVSLRRLHGRYLLSALLGAVGGPAAYYGGAGLGAMTAIPDTVSLIVLAIVWGVVVPALFRIASVINKWYAPR